ncbi:MAG: peptidase E [Verrucomicrobiota bacterium]
MQIVAIGGGEMKSRETFKIDQFIVELTGKQNPRALFIPTASGDAVGYWNTFQNIYEKALGCRTDSLFLLSRDRTKNCFEEKILNADLIYVGGGNSLKMMKLWRRLGVDRLLEKAGKRGSVLSGLSAGGICWHERGHSDSLSFSSQKEWSYIRVKGLGFRKGIFCPHLDAEKRRKPFLQMMMRHGGIGIACDNNAAVWYDDEKAVVKTSHAKAMVSLFRGKKGNIVEEKYKDGEVFEV